MLIIMLALTTAIVGTIACWIAHENDLRMAKAMDRSWMDSRRRR